MTLKVLISLKKKNLLTPNIWIVVYTISLKFLNSKIFNVFLKTLLLTKPAFIWSKVQ